jgi:hypothetical protein
VCVLWWLWRFQHGGGDAGERGQGAGLPRHDLPHHRYAPHARGLWRPDVAGRVTAHHPIDEAALGGAVVPCAGKKFRESDVVQLQSAGTGFAASGQVEVKKYKPTRF